MRPRIVHRALTVSLEIERGDDVITVQVTGDTDRCLTVEPDSIDLTPEEERWAWDEIYATAEDRYWESRAS